MTCRISSQVSSPLRRDWARRPQRHDLVWLAPALPTAELRIVDSAREFVHQWRQRDLPFVFARQPGNAEYARLGVTRPGLGPRQRIELHVPWHAIIRSAPPPPLMEMVAHAPLDWQQDLLWLARTLHQVGLDTRAYGSLVTQAFSGEACLRQESDVDLLVECRSRAEALTALSLLSDASGRPHVRLDGELRLYDGWAAAWRELASALAAGGGEVMAKCDDEIRLVDVDALLNGSLALPERGAAC